MIGYVQSISALRTTTRNGHTTRFFKFIMTNGTDTLQICACNELAIKYAEIVTQISMVIGFTLKILMILI